VSAEVAALVPLGPVTVTSTVPPPAGETAVIELAELTVKPAAMRPPNLTAVEPLKLDPVMLTEVPPASGPPLGLSPVTVGAGGGVGSPPPGGAGALTRDVGVDVAELAPTELDALTTTSI